MVSIKPAAEPEALVYLERGLKIRGWIAIYPGRIAELHHSNAIAARRELPGEGFCRRAHVGTTVVAVHGTGAVYDHHHHHVAARCKPSGCNSQTNLQATSTAGIHLYRHAPCAQATGSQVWTVVDGERGTTGVREAVITAELMDTGKLTMQDYKRFWAQDPTIPVTAELTVTFFASSPMTSSYDERFPEHPLSKVRRVLATLPESVVESGALN